MLVPPRILQDRCSIAEFEIGDPDLAQQLTRCGIGKKAGRTSIHFCGLAWIKHDLSFVFLPRKSQVHDPNEDLETAQLTMRTLARFGRDMANRVGVASGGEGESGLLALIAELAQDFLQYGIFSERMRHSSVHSGKPQWVRTVVKETAFLGAEGSVVYPSIRTTRSKDAHDSLLARVQARILLEVASHHAWWLDGLRGREEELMRYNPPQLPRPFWAIRLRLLLPELYATRAIRLAKTLISYLEYDCERDGGEFYFGVEDFHVVWEHMLRQVLKGVETGWNSRLPRPVYERKNGIHETLKRGLQTDIVLGDSEETIRIVDAKYYDATTVENSPATPDIIKQLFYDLALTSIVKNRKVKGSFVFPRSATETGAYEGIEFRHREGAPVSSFPRIDCFYLETSMVMRAFVDGRKISLPGSV